MAALKEHNILIVDDNRINTRITSAFLISLGASVETASNRDEAVRIAKNEAISAIFMNLMLPKVNGYQVTKELRNNDISIPIYAITSDSIDEMTKEMIDAGFTNVLTKPFDKDMVIRVLSKVQTGLPVFDQEQYVNTFKDKELQKDIIDTFLNEEEPDTKRMLDAFKTKDKDQIYSAIHYMKGSFSYLKASKILVLTQDILDRLKEDNVEFALENQHNFIEQYKELVKILKGL